MPRTEVLIVDDHRSFTDLFRIGLAAHPDLEVVAVAHTAAEAARIVRRRSFDVAIVDLGLPDAHGLDVVADIRAHRPEARVVVLSGQLRPDLARRARQAGADEALPKDGRLDAVLDAMRGRSAPAAPRAAGDPLTPREREVLALLADGRDVGVVAVELGLSAHTVRGHVKEILAKTGARSQLEAVVRAHRDGLVRISPA